jgi:hypothetical protein
MGFVPNTIGIRAIPIPRNYDTLRVSHVGYLGKNNLLH